MQNEMREILFRGKTKAIAGSPYNNGKPDGEWVKGYLYNDVGCWKIKQFETDRADYISYEVDPETIGQYTGVNDKNKTKIFEGDIISIPFEEDRSPYEENCVYYENAAVYFDNNRHGWYVKFFDDDEISLWEYDEVDVVIIGNIHDNPDLLKDGVDND
jgi:uncharacterized phage protein (TIGR01671 family)